MDIKLQLHLWSLLKASSSVRGTFHVQVTFPQTLTCDSVFWEPCLTLFSGSGSERIGFTLSGSSSFSTPRTFIALAFAASRRTRLSRRLRLTERPRDRDLDRLLEGDRENLPLYWLMRPLYLLQRMGDREQERDLDLEADLERLWREYLSGERLYECEWAL